MATPLDDALALFGYLSLDKLNEQTLKRDFKRLAIQTHPDRGGAAMEFDSLLSGFVYLSGVLRRQTGGRDKAGVLHPEDVQHAREDQFSSEMIVMVNEVLDSIQREEQNEFTRVFNEQFLAHRAQENGKGFSASETRGYSDWLASEEKSVVSFLPDGEYGPFTMAPPVMKEEDLHTLFEHTARCGKPPVTDLMLLPDQMAVRVASGGMSLISTTTDSFTSDLLEKPEYSDIHDAFTKENTIVDKIPEFQEKSRTFEDLLKERDIVYQTEEDRDLAAISLYEQAYQQQQAEHTRRIQEFFASTGASQWALPSTPSAPRSSDPQEEKATFVITLNA